MKRLSVIIFLLVTSVCTAQLKDDFTDSDFTANPAWSGDDSQFKINASGQLQLNSIGTGRSMLSTSNSLSSLANVEWHFWIKQSFSPSASNYGRVYLSADHADLTSPLNGYYLQFGEALSNDAIELFRQSDTISVSICRGKNGRIAAAFALGIKVVHDSIGLWTLSIDTAGGKDYIKEASGQDTVYTSSSHFGLVCNYTSSNATNFYFDNFYAGPQKLGSVQPPTPVEANDIVINEILSHVKTGGKEFVEIYNRSQKTIDLSNLQITKRDIMTGLPDAAVAISAVSLLIKPGDYLVLSDDPAVVKSQYTTLNGDAFQQMNLPTLVDGEDDIVLMTMDSTIIDEVRYAESWQFSLLYSFAGVSLERLSSEHPSQDSTNWHSAAESVGFATPGYRNSQSDVSTGNGTEISIDPEIFSPDNDGNHDVLNIHYSFPDAGNVANIVIYDARGRLTRTLINNELLGHEGYFVWDGLTNEKEKARIGMYIIYAEVYNINGNVKGYKKTCVLGGKLN